MRSTALILALALALPVVLAAPQGPAYPPPGGVALASAGDIGRGAGLTWSYSAIDMDRFNGLWWGPWSGDALQLALDGAVDSAGETLVFDFGSDTANGSARWHGSTKVRHLVGSAWTTETVPTRLTMRATFPNAAPLPFLDPTTVAIDGDVGAVVAVPGDYRVHLLLEAQRGGTWTAVKDLYDALKTDPACSSCVKISVGAGFYFDPNLPPTAGFGWSPDPPVEREEVTFTSTSSDPEGKPLALAWDLDGDGEFDDASGPTATTTFPVPGDRTVGLRATDDRGLVATSLQTVTVVDCSRGPVSHALRNVVYPAVANVAGNTVYFVACAIAQEHGI